MSKHRQYLKIVAFVGLTGCGKTAAAEYVMSKGVPRAFFGGVVLDAMKREYVEPGETNERWFREEWRAREGKDVVAKEIIAQINGMAAAGQHRVVADGLYSWTEYKALKHEFPGELTVVAIVAPKNIRRHRLANRPNRPLSADESDSRDWSEIENLEKGGPIAIADYYIHNDGSLDKLYKEIDQVLKLIKF